MALVVTAQTGLVAVRHIGNEDIRHQDRQKVLGVTVRLELVDHAVLMKVSAYAPQRVNELVNQDLMRQRRGLATRTAPCPCRRREEHRRLLRNPAWRCPPRRYGHCPRRA